MVINQRLKTTPALRCKGENSQLRKKKPSAFVVEEKVNHTQKILMLYFIKAVLN